MEKVIGFNLNWKNESENCYEETIINLICGDLTNEDDLNDLIGRNYEAYEFVTTIFDRYDPPAYRGSSFYYNLSLQEEKSEICTSLLGKIWGRNFYTIAISIRRDEGYAIVIDVLLKKRF